MQGWFLVPPETIYLPKPDKWNDLFSQKPLQGIDGLTANAIVQERGKFASDSVARRTHFKNVACINKQTSSFAFLRLIYEERQWSCSNTRR